MKSDVTVTSSVIAKFRESVEHHLERPVNYFKQIIHFHKYHQYWKRKITSASILKIFEEVESPASEFINKSINKIESRNVAKIEHNRKQLPRFIPQTFVKTKL